MDLAQTGTLSALAHDTWPLGIGARFVVDPDGAPALCFNPAHRSLAVDNRSSFHVKVLQFFSFCLFVQWNLPILFSNLIFGLIPGVNGHSIKS